MTEEKVNVTYGKLKANVPNQIPVAFAMVTIFVDEVKMRERPLVHHLLSCGEERATDSGGNSSSKGQDLPELLRDCTEHLADESADTVEIDALGS